MASVVGLGGFAGAIGGMIMQLTAGYITELTGSFLPIFAVSGSMYLVAVAIIHLLVPRLEPANLGEH